MEPQVGQVWKLHGRLTAVVVDIAADGVRKLVPMTMVNHSLQADMKKKDLLLCPPIVSARAAGIGIKFHLNKLFRMGGLSQFEEHLGDLNFTAMTFLQAAEKVALTGNRDHLRRLDGMGTFAWWED